MEKLIYIVEDEERLAELVSDYLIKDGFETRIFNDGKDFVEEVRSRMPSMILLDIMLPEKDGLTIAREVRQFSDVPIIMITARVEEIDRLLGLELGADDYICKPFSFREVVARVKTVLRRVEKPNESTENSIVFIDEKRGEVKINGMPVDLTAIELKLLKVMSENPGVIFTRENLMDRIYTDGRIVSDRTIDSHVKKLRKKISMIYPDKDIIKSVYSVGYKFEISLV